MMTEGEYLNHSGFSLTKIKAELVITLLNCETLVLRVQLNTMQRDHTSAYCGTSY